MSTNATEKSMETLRTLPGDDVRQIMWRFQDRYDLQMLVQSVRRVARGPVARLVANGGRNTHEWTPAKAAILKEFDDAGITAAFMDPAHGGMIAGPKNVALALVAFELAWVDAGAATGSLASCLGLAPIYERGTPEQREHYFGKCAPAQPGEDRKPWRAAFALTEPIPYVGVETGLLSGRVSVAEWKDGQEPTLQIEKRGRFITNMGFANFVTAAVDSGDERFKGSCMVILEENDPGNFDRGTPTKKLVHQLSSTNDPVFSLRIPASRIVGGYTVKNGVIIPNYSHGEIIEAVFRKSRVTVGLMSAAKMLSAVEPVIRYHRDRFRGGSAVPPGSPRYELGLQQKEDALNRLLDIWAFGEAAASLGFAAARAFDELEPMEQDRDRILAKEVAQGGTAIFRAMRKLVKPTLEYLELSAKPAGQRDEARYKTLHDDPLTHYLIQESLANVLCPACKLWNTGVGATYMREAVALMGGYGITEDCPGFLPNKWMDLQLEATYEGPEAVQRRQLTLTMVQDVFLQLFRNWMGEMRELAKRKPQTGAHTLATAMETWLWSVEHLQNATDANGEKLYTSNRQGVTFPMADALCWLLASRQQILDAILIEERGPENPVVAEGLEGTSGFMYDLCQMMAARAAGEVGRVCAELVHGYNAPSASAEGLGVFRELRARLDACLAGSLLAKDRAAQSLTKVMIPAALDYPA